jgi:hypothetical protein
MRKLYKILVRKPEENKVVGRSRRRWEHIRIDLREKSWEYVDSMHLLQDRDQWRALVNTVMNLRVPQKAGNFLTSRVTFSLSIELVS